MEYSKEYRLQINCIFRHNRNKENMIELQKFIEYIIQKVHHKFSIL